MKIYLFITHMFSKKHHNLCEIFFIKLMIEIIILEIFIYIFIFNFILINIFEKSIKIIILILSIYQLFSFNV